MSCSVLSLENESVHLFKMFQSGKTTSAKIWSVGRWVGRWVGRSVGRWVGGSVGWRVSGLVDSFE